MGAEGALVGREALSAPVTALLRAGEHRVDQPRLPIGAADGTIHLLSEEERRR